MDALAKNITEEDTQKNKFLTFKLENEFYGIEIKYVTEIIGIQKIIEVPELPNYVKGIINLRGKIIPTIDVRLKFGKKYRDYNDRTSIVVVEIKDTLIGLIVDIVSEVISILDTDIEKPPSAKTGFNNKYIENIGKVDKNIILLLNCNYLLAGEEVEVLIDYTNSLEEESEIVKNKK